VEERASWLLRPGRSLRTTRERVDRMLMARSLSARGGSAGGYRPSRNASRVSGGRERPGGLCGGARRPAEHGLQGHGRDARARAGGGDCDRGGDGDWTRRPPARPDRDQQNAASARNRSDRAPTRDRRHRDCGRGCGGDPAYVRDRDRFRSRLGPPRRGFAGGRGRAGRAARRALGRARPRCAADGPALRDREEALFG
jgi:hypothetical protein